MSGVWVFSNGVVRLVEKAAGGVDWCRRKVLVHSPTNEVMSSYEDPHLLQYHKTSTLHLISLPKDFNKFKSMHIVVNNRNIFQVRHIII